MLLWNSQVSGNCYKVRLLLAQLGIAYERREVSVVDRSKRAELLGGKNPALRVPTLELDDGRCLAESDATDPFERAQVLQWLFFEQYQHEPTIAVVRFWVAYSGEAERYASQVDAKRVDGYVALDAMEGRLADHEFIVGERYSIADIGLYANTHVAHEGGFDLDPYPAIRGWVERVATRPGHVPIDS